jgi:hypothetical protein
MPPEVQSNLDLIAQGKATSVDLVTVLLGPGGLMLAAAIPPATVQEGPGGPYYLLEGSVAIGAKGDLLLIGLSPVDLAASLGALAKAENRLAMKRRFESPNYFQLHVDMPTVVDLAREEIEEQGGDVKSVLSMFKAPMELEMAFDAKPGSFLISSGFNIMESLAVSDRFKDIEPIAGENLLLTGGGRLFFGFAGPVTFHAADLKAYPEVAKAWVDISKKLAQQGITETDIENLLSGSFSLIGGSDATALGKATRGGYLAISGQKGAAAKILRTIVDNEAFSQAVPLSPVKAEGWDALYMVDPALVPVSLLLGVSKDTLFFGIVDPKGLGKTPELSPEASALLKEPFYGEAFIDTKAIWEYLRNEAADPNGLLGAELGREPAMADIVKDILSAELAVSFIKLWAPTLETSFTELTLVDVPQDKRLLPKLLSAASTLGALNDDEEEEEEGSELSELALLLYIKSGIESVFSEDAEITTEDLKEVYGGVVAFAETENGDLYIGHEVSDDTRREMIEEAQKFELKGSAGLDVVPGSEAYNGQSVVWIKIAK